MSLSSIIQQTEEVLDEVLRIIRQECEKPTSVLCETDRRDFVEDEESLRKRLRETEESNWRRLLCMPSPQAVKYLGDAKALRHRVKEDIRTKERTLIFGMGDPPSSLDHGQGPAINSMDARTPEANPGRLLADANSEPASSIITSPLNMRCSVTEASESELIVYPVARNDNDYTSDLHEAINTPLGTSSDRIRDSSSGGQRRSPPPPPTSRRMGQSTNSRQTTSISGSSRGSRPIRRPAAPPPPSTGQFRP
ncbi:hypothetical protein J3R82DRAFT_11002 [Butyriboletus roseoflavus]|nr:hypothetical protein J3R82DRAFT_11002 [Butyriboletus roseoflavus]